MKVTNIQVITLNFQYPPGKEFHFAGGCCTGRLSCLVKVSTDEGIEGVGSVYSHPDLVRTIVEHQFNDLLVGEDPREVEQLWERLYTVTRWYGRKGVAVSTLGAVDTALWDIRGKIASKPVYQMLGAKRHSVPAYASGLLWKDSLTELQEEAHGHLSKGFIAVKTRLGRNYEYDVAALRVLRDAIGPAGCLMVDGNGRYSLPQAQRLVPNFEEARIFWLEEPFVPEDIDSYTALRPLMTGIPLAAGENDFGMQGFRELIDRQMVDIVQPDASRAGGITECRRIGVLAAQHGLRVATHTWSDAVALVSNMHLIASLPTGITVEVDQSGNPLIDELLTEALRVVDGEIAMPQRPGLGIELNQDIVDRYTVPPTHPMPEGNYADMVFGRRYYRPAGPYEAATQL